MRPFLVLASIGTALALQAQQNIQLLGHYDYQATRNSELSNLWGYDDGEGHQYALVGVNGRNDPFSPGGLSIVDVTDPAHPVEVYFRESPVSMWREIKTWGHHAYITTEAVDGLTIVDLSPLPESTALPVTLFQGDGWNTAHSLFIDENGRLYIHGANRGVGGVIMYDLTQDPMAPVEVGTFDQWYCHDSFARGDTLYAAHIYDGFFSVVDVSDPASPQVLGVQVTPSLFTHNCWLDASGSYLYTTDEVNNAYVAAYDISDPSDIVEVDRLRSESSGGAIPHNTYWLDHYLVTSYYSYGVTIYDATRPDNLVEVGHYDTSPFTGGNFHGAWGVYPFLPSGDLLVSDIETGLYILRPEYVRAAFLEGRVTNALTGVPIANAVVAGAGPTQTTGITGTYSSGTAQAGAVTLNVQADGYVGQVITDVVLENGATVVRDIALYPIGTGMASMDDAATAVRTIVTAEGTIQVETMPGARFRLFDIHGRVVREGSIGTAGRATIPGGLPSAAYVLHLAPSTGTMITRTVVVP